MDQARWFTQEVHAHEASLRSYLHGAFPSVNDVDDVVQESLLRIWQARLNRAIRSPKSFLYQVARNLAIDLVRRRKISPVISCPDLAALSVMEEGPGIAEAACTKEELAFLAQAIQALPARIRAVIMLRQIRGLSQKEIATQLGLSELSVQKYVVRGLDRLEQAMLRRYGK